MPRILLRPAAAMASLRRDDVCVADDAPAEPLASRQFPGPG